MHSRGIRIRLGVLYAVTAFLLSSYPLRAQKLAKGPAPSQKALKQVDLPLTFEANQGQSDGRVRFLARGAGYGLYLTQDEAVLAVAKPIVKGGAKGLARPTLQNRDTVNLSLWGSNPKAVVKGEKLLAGKSNYYIGNNPKLWRTGIANYARVRYHSVYPGIDVLYYGNQGVLEHDFVVAPGADPKRIQLIVTGANSTRIENGDLVLDLGAGSVRLLKPIVYQLRNGKRDEIAGEYQLKRGNRVTFKLGKYDRRRELVIDPKLNYATYLGGTAFDTANAVAANSGTIYVAGTTFSADFPTSAAEQNSCSSCSSARTDAFVTAVAGGNLVYSTFLGGAATDEACSISVSPAGTAFVGGFTASDNFPALGAGLPTTPHGGTFDGFITELNSSGAVNRSGFLGGSGEDQIHGIRYDPSNAHVVVTGYTTSTDFPLQNFNISPLAGQLYESADAGSTWSQISGGPPDNLGGMDVRAIAVVPGATTKYYVGGTAGVYVSTDLATWVSINSGFNHNKISCLVNDPLTSGAVWACTDAGVFHFDPGTSTWSALTNGMGALDVRSIVVSPLDPTIVYAATNSGVFQTMNSGALWNPLNSGLQSTDVYSLVTDSSGFIYAGTSSASGSPVFYQFNGGNWFNPGGNGLPNGIGVNGNSFAFDPNTGKIYVGLATNGAYVTSDGGANWQQLGTQLVVGYSSYVNAFAIESNSTTIYAATEDGIWKSVDSGANWALTSDSTIAATSVRALAIDPTLTAQTGNTVLLSGSNAKQGFVTSFDSSMSFVVSAPFGGDGVTINGGTEGRAVTTDAQGNIFVAGKTPSLEIPALGFGDQPQFSGIDDALLMKLDFNGNPIWSTYLGGTGYETANAVAADTSSVYIGGFTNSGADFPTLNAFQSSCPNSCASGAAFLAKYDTGGAKQFSTYFGGNDYDEIFGMGVDQSGNIYFAATTNNTTLPSVNPLGASPQSAVNAYVGEFDPTGASLLFSSYLSGSSDTHAQALAVDASSNIYVAGTTSAADFPTTSDAVGISNSGAGDAFVAQITNTGVTNDVAISVTPDPVSVSAGTPVTYTITITNLTGTGPGASNVQFSTNLPLDSLNSPDGTCSQFPSVCHFGTLAPGASVSATAVYTYQTTGTNVDTFLVRTDDNDPNTANNQQNVTADVSVGNSDLGISVSAPASVPHDGLFDYTVTVSNLGPASASEFTFNLSIDSAATFSNFPANCSADGTTLFCSLTGLNVNESQNFTVSVIAPGTQGSISATATVNGLNDPNNSNDTATASTSVGPSADVYLFTSSNGSVAVGAPTAIDFVVGNNGSDGATNVSVTFSLGNEFVLNSVSGLNCTGTATITCAIGNIAAGGSVQGTLTVTPTRVGTFTLDGAATGTEADPSLSNNQSNTTFLAGPTQFAGEQYVVTESNSGDLALYSAGTTNSLQTIKVGDGPTTVAIDASGRYAFVGSTGFSTYTSVVDLTNGKEIKRLYGVRGRPMVETPDGSKLIANVGSLATDAIAIVDTSSLQVSRTVSLDGQFGDQVGLQDLAVFSGTATNNKVYLQLASTITPATPLFATVAIDLNNFSITQVSGSNVGQFGSGLIKSIAANGDGTRIYALRRNPDEILVINTNTDAVIQTISLPMAPLGIAVTKDPNDPNGQFAYVVGSSQIVSVNLQTGTVGSPVSIGFNASVIVITGDQSSAHVFRLGAANGNNAALVGLNNLRLGGEVSIQRYQVGPYVGSVDLAPVSDSPLDFSPQVQGAFPSQITDTSLPTTVSILGSDFTSGAQIKIGNLDPLPSTFVSSGRLDVTLPAGVAEQDADIVVTLPNPQELQTRRNVSGASFSPLFINTPFQLNDSLLILRRGDSQLSLISQSKNDSKVQLNAVNPFSLAVSPDSKEAYVSGPIPGTGGATGTDGAVEVRSLTDGSLSTTIPVPGDIPGFQDGLVTGTDPVDGKPVLYFVSKGPQSQNERLTIVDIDPASAGFHTVKRTITGTFGNYNASYAIAANSRYVYSGVDAVDPNTGAFLGTQIAIFDVQKDIVTRLANINSTFGGEEAPNHLRISPDGNWLIVPATDGSLKVLDINTDPLSPTLKATISDAGRTYKTFQVVGSRLYAFDAVGNVFSVFNFDPASNNLAKLGSFTIPGAKSQYESPFLIDPTGAFAYVSLKDEDSLVVLDANKVAASDPTSLIAKGRIGPGVEMILLPTVTAPQVNLAITDLSANPSPAAQNTANLIVSANVTNNGFNAAHNVVATINVPAELPITAVTWSAGSTANVCTVNGTQITCNIPSIAGGDHAALTLVSGTVPAVSSLAFTIGATSAESDTNPTDNNADFQVQVVPGGDLAATIQPPTGSITAGQTINFSITLTNLGPASTSAVVSLGAFLNNLSVQAPPGVNCSSPQFCTIPTLNNGDAFVLQFTGDVRPDSPTLGISATVSPSGGTPDPDFNNNSQSVTFPVASTGLLAPRFLVTDDAISNLYPLTPLDLGFTSSIRTGVLPGKTVVMPNGRIAFVMNLNSDYVSVLDLGVQHEIQRIRGLNGRAAVLTSDASQLIVSDGYRNDVAVVDTTTFQVVRRIPLGFKAPNLALVGTKLYMMQPTAAPVSVLDINSGVVTNIAGTNVYGFAYSQLMAVAPDGKVLVLGGGTPAAPATLLRIDPSTDTVAQSLTMPVNTETLTLAVNPIVGANLTAYVSYDNTFRSVDITQGSPTVGQFTNVNATLPFAATASAITPDGSTIAIVQHSLSGSSGLARADLPSLSDGGSFLSSSIVENAGSIVAANVDSLPSPSAPVVTQVTPAQISNDTAQTITLTGSGFSSDALVKVGAADPIAATFISDTQITATVPAFTASGSQTVLVINRNASGPLDTRNATGEWLGGSLQVTDGPEYLPTFNAYVANYGDRTLTAAVDGSVNSDTSGVTNPWGLTVTPNGIIYATSGAAPNFASSLGIEGLTIGSLPGTAAYGDAIANVPDPQTGRTIVLVPSTYPVGPDFDWRLNIVDADPFSPAANVILRSINANSGGATSNPGGFAASPNGQFAFLFFNATDDTGRLAVYNLTTNAATVLTTSSLGIDDFVQDMQVSPDNKYLLVANNLTNSIKVFDVTNATAPALVTTITPTIPQGALTSCCNMRIVNNRLWVFDPGTMILQAFNFNPTASDFAPTGSVTVPGSADPTFQGGLAVSPDGTTVFVAEYDNDAFDVYDAAKVAVSDPTALITRIATGLAPVSIALNTIPTFSTTADLKVSLSHTPDPAAASSTLDYNVVVTNLGPSSSGQVVVADDLPSGMSLVQATTPQGVTCTGTTSIRCTITSLPPDAPATITLTVNTPAASGTVNNAVRVGPFQSSIPDPDATNNVASDSVLVGFPDLAITATSDVTSPAINQLVTYAVTIKNNGVVDATNARAVLHLDAGTFTASPDCNLDGDEFCDLGTLSAGQSVTVHATAQMPSTQGTVTLTANVSEDQSDATVADNAFTYVLPVGGGADLVLTPAGAPVVIGGVPTYTVTVTNDGPDLAPNVTVTDSLDRYQFVSATASSGSCSFDGVRISCAVGDLAANANVTVNISVVPPDSGWASNEFHAQSNVLDPVPTNNVANMGPFGGTVGNTRAGVNVLVDALDSLTGTGVNFLFANVTRPGLTSVTSLAAAQPPAGYRYGAFARTFDFSTTASYAGAINLAVQTAAMQFHHPNRVHLFHLENGAWVDRTSAVDMTRGLVAGVTRSLSPFMVVEPVNTVPMANAGVDRSVPATTQNGATVTLNAAASTDADGDSLTYHWSGPFPEGNGNLVGLSPAVTLPMGTSKLTLVVDDGETDSAPVTVNVSVTDFLIATPPNQILLKRGQSTTFEVAVTPEFGDFDSAVSLACGNLPVGVSCSFSTNSVTPGSLGTTATVTLTASPNAGVLDHSTPVLAIWFGGLPVFGILLAGSARRKRGQGWVILALLIMLLLAGIACGGGGGSLRQSNPPSTSTTTTNITITGSAGALQHSATATVVVQ